MKTQEEVVRQHAVGPISIYKIYQEGYQDRELDDWAAFRREAAKDILCAIVSHNGFNYHDPDQFTADAIAASVGTAGALIQKLKEEQK